MFKHILIPTDGSRLAAKGIKAGIRLAKALRAKVTGVYVAFPYSPPMYSEGIVYAFAAAGATGANFLPNSSSADFSFAFRSSSSVFFSRIVASRLACIVSRYR